MISGTVIQIRGPIVEIAVPPVRLTPNGQSTFWSKRAVLARPGIALHLRSLTFPSRCPAVSLVQRKSILTLRSRPCPPVSHTPSNPSPCLSADPATDLRRLFAGSNWNAPVSPGFPVRTAAGEWMIPVIIDLPYMRCSPASKRQHSRRKSATSSAPHWWWQVTIRRTISQASDRIHLRCSTSGVKSSGQHDYDRLIASV